MFIKYRKQVILPVSVIIFIFLILGGLHLFNDCRHIQDEAYLEDEINSEVSINDIPQEGDIANPITSTPKPETETKNAQTVKKGYNIHINLDSHMMYVYKDGQLIKTYQVSGGKTSTPSPVGTWKIISKDTWGEGFGGAWLGFNVPWGKYGIHGTREPWAVGKSNASKGCIRMKNKDVRELYKIVPHGTTVTIEHANSPFRTMKSGDIGSDVLEVQKALKNLKYYNGSANGRFGSNLKTSVMKFQKDNKLYANGSINKQTYNLIMAKYRSLLEQ